MKPCQLPRLYRLCCQYTKDTPTQLDSPRLGSLVKPHRKTQNHNVEDKQHKHIEFTYSTYCYNNQIGNKPQRAGLYGLLYLLPVFSMVPGHTHIITRIPRKHLLPIRTIKNTPSLHLLAAETTGQVNADWVFSKCQVISLIFLVWLLKKRWGCRLYAGKLSTFAP